MAPRILASLVRVRLDRVQAWWVWGPRDGGSASRRRFGIATAVRHRDLLVGFGKSALPALARCADVPTIAFQRRGHSLRACTRGRTEPLSEQTWLVVGIAVIPRGALSAARCERVRMAQGPRARRRRVIEVGSAWTKIRNTAQIKEVRWTTALRDGISPKERPVPTLRRAVGSTVILELRHRVPEAPRAAPKAARQTASRTASRTTSQTMSTTKHSIARTACSETNLRGSGNSVASPRRLNPPPRRRSRRRSCHAMRRLIRSMAVAPHSRRAVSIHTAILPPERPLEGQ